MTIKVISVQPKHWWQYLSIRFWINKRTVEKIFNHWWHKNNTAIIARACADQLIYGNALVRVGERDAR